MQVLKVFSALALLASAACVSACIYEDGPPRDLQGNDDSNSAVATPASSSSSSSSSGSTSTGTTANSASTSAMLVQVDTDQTMNALGGEGVGVFVEYGKGGHWHVWWTCDTNQTQLSCNFAVTITAATGAITNIDSTELAGGLYTAPTSSSLATNSTTTTDEKGLKFDTAAGAIITIEASVGSVEDGSLLFFVEDGKVNGGFTGKLTNPLRFQGSTP